MDEEGYVNDVDNFKKLDTGTTTTDMNTRGTGQMVTFSDIGSADAKMTNEDNKSYAEALRMNLGTVVFNNENEIANETLIK